jgi:hypothetical protein
MIARTLVVDVDGTIIATHCESKSQVDYYHRQRTILLERLGWVPYQLADDPLTYGADAGK